MSAAACKTVICVGENAVKCSTISRLVENGEIKDKTLLKDITECAQEIGELLKPLIDRIGEES